MSLNKLLKLLGPGLLYAGAAIGVSHLVQSTRAGAGFGFDLLWVLILANIIKYPFFEFAPRYASATGKSLIEGYQSIGKWAVVAFALLTLATMFTIQAAVTIVTAGLIANVFNISMGLIPLSTIILGTTVIILIIGKYSILDNLIKVVVLILAISTITAVIYAFGSGYHPDPVLANEFDWFKRMDIIFLIAFIGWMPAPIDVSVWSSLWNVEKAKTLTFKPSLKESLLDFRIGYIGTAVLAGCFLTLGALVMYGGNETISPDGTEFAGQLILLAYFATSMRYMVDVATTLSFITAPVLAYLNYKVITGKLIPASSRPGRGLKIWALAGIVFLSGFTLFYIAWITGLAERLGI